MSQTTKSLFTIGTILTVYGYLCRLLNIYFFWDSKTIGCIILFAGLLSFLLNLRKRRKQQSKKLFWVTLGIAFLGLGLLLAPVVVTIFRTSDAYAVAVDYLKNDPMINQQVGNVKGFGQIPMGSISVTRTNGRGTGQAVFEITVRGDKKYTDVSIELGKTGNSSWTVMRLRSE